MMLLIKIDQSSITFDKIRPIVDLNPMEIVSTIDWTAEIERKSRLKADSNPI